MKDRKNGEEQTREGSDSERIKTEESDNGVKAEDETSFLDWEVIKKEVSKAEADVIDYVTDPDNIAEKEEAEMEEIKKKMRDQPVWK